MRLQASTALSHRRPNKPVDDEARSWKESSVIASKAFTESPGSLSDHPYGFRKGRSTINAIENFNATTRSAPELRRQLECCLLRVITQLLRASHTMKLSTQAEIKKYDLDFVINTDQMGCKNEKIDSGYTLLLALITRADLLMKVEKKAPALAHQTLLWLHLDRRLTWKTYIWTKRKQFGLKLKRLYWLIGRKSSLSLENKVLLYKSILKPVWQYGIQLWGAAAKSNIDILERFQSKVLRSMVDAPWFVPNEVIRKDLRYQRLVKISAACSLDTGRRSYDSKITKILEKVFTGARSATWCTRSTECGLMPSTQSVQPKNNENVRRSFYRGQTVTWCTVKMILTPSLLRLKCECLPRTMVRTQKARATHGMSTAVSDGLRSPQGQTSVEKPGGPSLMELGPLPTPRTSPYTMVKAITGKIIVAPLHCKEKDAKLPSPAEFATGTLEDKLERLDGLIRGLGQFIQGKSNLHKEVISYQVSVGMALSALRKSLESQVPPRPPAADKAVCTSPMFTGSATSKRLATSPLASHATPKRHAVTPASKQHDKNNNEVGDQDGFVLVDRRRHRQRKQTAATPVAVHARQQPKPRPVQRRARHRPDVIVIKAKDASKYADILRSLKSDPTLQQEVGSSVNNIRRSAAGALMLQLKKGVENASDLGEELGKVLGTAATASALLQTSSIEIKDLDECATKEEVTAALDALLGVPLSKRDPVKSLRKAYAGKQVAVVALPDDLAATALKLGHVRIGWVNCRIRAREEAARCYRCWSPGHLELPSGPEDHPGPPMMRILQLNLNHCEAAQDLLVRHTISRLRIDVAILCEQYKNLAPPNTWLADADGQAATWVHGGIPVQERPVRVHPYFAWARIGGIFFFSVYAPPRLSEREFSALLANITEEARGRRPLVIAGDFNAWSTEWGCRETRPRATILLDSLALLDAVLLNTATTRPSSSRSRTTGLRAGPRRAGATGGTPVLSMWTVSLPSCPAHRSLPRPRRIWRRASCPSSPAHVMPRCPRQILAAVVSPVYWWWTPEIADLRRSCLRARRLFQRSRGRHDEETHSANYASARRLLRVAIKTSKRRCWRQLCDEVNNDVWGKPYRIAMSRTPRMPAGQAAQLPLLVRARAVAALFPRVPSGPALRLPRRAEELIPAVTLEELKGAQSRINERSKPGPDGIPNSALKIAIAARPDIFLRVYTMCLETGVFPSGWKRQRLVLLPQQGKPSDEPSSYRPLYMLDTAGKILERIICDRLEAFTERPGGLSERQYGFRKGRSTIDAIEDVVSTPVRPSPARDGTAAPRSTAPW
ncbi:unnamed protein product [Trichogramma brassicae]|uniref:Endonuclease/exonuclease/phosphatase domain-containing protein n=1 Tax=Trichogramma brassicae TaxID=86971 RepID=A0A6H5J307_9HYME|nr:unnamed protein product [Trichogramma brassicae]